MRDDFSEGVKIRVAERVNRRCSRPTCKAQTSGPQIDPTKALNVGVAAHITAAAPSGPRYDVRLSPEERRHISNAIWLCQNCAKLVDNDSSRFTAQELRTWKTDAEAEALESIGKTAKTTSEIDGEDEEDDEPADLHKEDAIIKSERYIDHHYTLTADDTIALWVKSDDPIDALIMETRHFDPWVDGKGVNCLEYYEGKYKLNISHTVSQGGDYTVVVFNPLDEPTRVRLEISIWETHK